MIGKCFGLVKFVEVILGMSKLVDGLISFEWYKEGCFDLIEEYCCKDVEILCDFYLYGCCEGFVFYEDCEGCKLWILVDW